MGIRSRHVVGGLAFGALGVALVLVFLYRQSLLEWVHLGEQRRLLGVWRTPGWDMAGHSPIQDGSYNCWIFESELDGLIGIRFRAKRFFISTRQSAFPKQEAASLSKRTSSL